MVKERFVQRHRCCPSLKTALEDIVTIHVFAVDLPGEFQQQFVKNLFQKPGFIKACYQVDLPGSPGMNGRIHIVERLFTCNKLTIQMHVPFAQQQNQLPFSPFRVNQSDSRGAESHIPGRMPGNSHFSGIDSTSRLYRCRQLALRPSFRLSGGRVCVGSPSSQISIL